VERRAPRGLTLRKVPIDTDEGTWMNVDVSPDGSRIAFDMLGDIYVMPITGGTPTRIAEGLAYEQQPRWSPDGSRIAFVSDRGGGDNIWIMRADGSDKKQLTKEDFRLLNQPSWSPDGRYIVAKKHFTTTRSLGTGEVWLYHVDGGTGVQLVKRVNEKHQKELGRADLRARRQAHLLHPQHHARAAPSNMRRTPTARCSRSSATSWRRARPTG
jgi:tricorn protease-like protein